MTTVMKHLRGRPLYAKLVSEQIAWIEKCGGDLAGYLANYKTRTPENVRDIYYADIGELRRLEERLNSYRS